MDTTRISKLMSRRIPWAIILRTYYRKRLEIDTQGRHLGQDLGWTIHTTSTLGKE